MPAVWSRVHAKRREPMTSLNARDVRASITKSAKAAAMKAHVAVTYFGTGASKLLPLRAGARLPWICVSGQVLTAANPNCCSASCLKIVYGGRMPLARVQTLTKTRRAFARLHRFRHPRPAAESDVRDFVYGRVRVAVLLPDRSCRDISHGHRACRDTMLARQLRVAREGCLDIRAARTRTCSDKSRDAIHPLKPRLCWRHKGCGTAPPSSMRCRCYRWLGPCACG